ncbi:MAG TPA: acyltransferase [Usitatibacter sp.]|nr:acyltransferase [Usitatibacter sp.]
MAATSPIPALAAPARAQTALARPRYDLLDGLRGLAAIAIVVHHATATSGHRELFPSAATAVEFFFCVAGFVTAAAHQQKLAEGMRFTQYGRRRLLRLYPMYAIGTLLGVAAMAMLQAHGLTNLGTAGMAGAFALNALFLPYFNFGYFQQVLATPIRGAVFPFDPPAWTLFFLLATNLLYAATARAGRGIAWTIVAAAGASLWLAGLAYGEAPGWGADNLTGGFPRVLFSFFAGVMIYRLRDRLPLRLPAALLVAATLALYEMPHFEGHLYYWLVAAIAIVPLLVAAASNCPVAEGNLFQRLCRYSGRISYPLYCIHYPLLMLLPLAVPTATPFPLLLAGFVAACLGLSHFLARLVEAPVQARLSSPRRAP